MVAGVEDDDGAAARFAGQLHLSAAERARRTTSGAASPSRAARATSRAAAAVPHGFTRPTAPIVREVAIGETITVADLAQKIAVKAAEVIKALMKLGSWSRSTRRSTRKPR